MKKIIALVLFFMMSVMLPACSGNSDEDKEKEPVLEESQLYGTWEFKDSGDIQQIIIKDDGTYRQITKVSGYSLDHTDNYVIKDNCLVLYYDEMGITYTYKVSFEGTDKMTFFNAGNGEQIITYTKKK